MRLTCRGGWLYFADVGATFVSATNFRAACGVSPGGSFETDGEAGEESMFCPRCGQQQVSEGVRFCPRCGLSLASVPALLAGEAAADDKGSARKGILSGKRSGGRRGAKLMFFSAVLFPIFFGLAIAADSPGPLIVPFTVFLAGLAWMVYFVLFGEELLPVRGAKGRDELREGRGAQALPPSTFVPASGFGARRADTADMAKPPSVTEQTTRLLDEE